jgi:uncharacterized membrane protein YphA (DoxX/SURF4 family)
LGAALRIGLGVLFAWAGASKFGLGSTFASLIANYRLLPAEANQILAVTLPWVEFVAGVLLILKLWVRPAGLVVAGLAVVFLAAVGSALARGLDIPCGCFGGFWGAKVGWATVGLEVTLLAAALTLVVFGGGKSPDVARAAAPAGPKG